MNSIIIGCGRMGVGVAQSLCQHHQSVTVIDPEATAFERLGTGFTGHTILGSGLDREVLLQAGIERADGLAAVTGSDDTNVVLARLARQVFRVPRVVARLHDPRHAAVYRQLGIQTIIPLTWGIQRLSELLCYTSLNTTLSLGSGEVDLMEVELPYLLAGRTVNELTLLGEIHVAAISREGRTFLPTLGTVFQAGDLVHLVVLGSSAVRLTALLGEDRG
jgi:trk system potassium uptake protein TrkA